MVEQTELLIPFEDLTRVSFTCRKCKAETTLDREHVDKLPKEGNEWNDSQKLPQCSICGQPPSEDLRSLLTKFLKEWPDGSKQDFKDEEIRFRIKLSQS